MTAIGEMYDRDLDQVVRAAAALLGARELLFLEVRVGAAEGRAARDELLATAAGADGS